MVGAPLGRRIATFAFALPFAPFGTLCLRDTRAVGLVVPISFAPMALNVVGRGGHSCSTSSDGGPRRFPRQLVNVKISGCLLDLVEGERAVPVVHLLDEFELLRERVQEQISVRIIENFLPHVRETQPKVIHLCDEVSRVTSGTHRAGEELLPARPPGFLRISIEALLQGFPSRNSITQAALFRALMRPHGDIRRTFSQKEQDGINVVVCRLPGSHSIRVGLLRARCSVKDFKHFPRIQTEGLAYFSPPLAVIGRTFAFTDGVQSPI